MNPSTQTRMDLRKLVIQRQADRQSVEMQDAAVTPIPEPRPEPEQERSLSETAIRRLVKQLETDPGETD